MSNNSRSKYLIYNCWEVVGSHGGIIAGSHLYDMLVMTEEEAKQAVILVEQRNNEYKQKYHFEGKNRFVYIENRPEWFRLNS
jgi:hypothetical protein